MPFPTFQSVDEIPEPFRGEYEEREGVWHPKVPDVTGLQSALGTERERAEKADKARQLAEKRAKELERAKEAEGAGISEETLAKLRKEDEERRAAELEPVKTENATLREKLRKYEIEDPARKLFVTEGGMFSEDWDDPDIRAGILRRLDKTADGTTLVVLDEKGNVTSEKPDAFRDAYAKAWPRRFQADVGSGGGAARTSGGAPPSRSAHDAARERQARSRAYQM